MQLSNPFEDDIPPLVNRLSPDLFRPLAASNGRVHVVTPAVATAHTGHGNVMPMSLHGGHGRAGGGAELGGLRALDFYHQRSAVQASPEVLAALSC